MPFLEHGLRARCSAFFAGRERIEPVLETPCRGMPSGPVSDRCRATRCGILRWSRSGRATRPRPRNLPDGMGVGHRLPLKAGA